MRNVLFTILKKHNFLGLFLFIGLNSFTQTPDEPQILSPNTASLGSFGNVPVNHFVGSPNISIPLYNITVGSISVPLSLNYNKELVKPAIIPGWVGFGWNLNCGGVITRKVNGKPDEFIDISNVYHGFIEEGKSFLDNDDYDSYSSDALLGYYNSTVGAKAARTDIEADEFTFNFLGYSGRFFYKNEEDGWVLFSDDENIKIELIGYNADANFDRYSTIAYGYKHRFFAGFRLTIGNGTVFTFGGKTSAMEISDDYSSNLNASIASNFIIDSWYLTEIRDIEGNIVTFKYNRENYPICRVGHSLHQVISGHYSYRCSVGIGEGSDFLSPIESEIIDIDYCDKQGRVIIPAYLEQIQAISNSGELYATIDFGADITRSLTYSADYLMRNSKFYSPNSGFFNYSWMDYELFSWLQLYEVTITERSQRAMKYGFSYKPEELSIRDQKLTLYSITKYNKDIESSFIETENYNFDYNPFHYGDNAPYYNSYYDILGYNIDKYGYKLTGLELIGTKGNGLISKITYPTKGYTEYTWEGNDYRKHVAKNRRSLTSVGSNRNTSGYRIKSIEHFDLNDNLLKSLTYKYVNEDNTTSSGVLNGDPENTNKLKVTERSPTDANINVKISFVIQDINGLTNYSNNGQSHIGYSRVVEQDNTANVNKTYTYTNFGSIAEEDGDAYYDRSLNSYIGWADGEDQYKEMLPIGSLLGKLLKIEEDNGLFTKTTSFSYHEYYSSQETYKRIKMNNSYSFTIPRGVCFPADPSFSITFASSLAERHRRSKLSRKVETTSGAYEKTNTYFYNEDGLLYKQIKQVGENQYYFTYLYYPLPEDRIVFGSTEPSYWGILASKYNHHNFSNPFLTKTVFADFSDDYNEITEVIDAKYIEYYDELPYRPKKVYTLDVQGLEKLGFDIDSDSEIDWFDTEDWSTYINDGTFRESSYFQYDENGNIIAIEKNGSKGIGTYFFWDFDQRIPIAKIVTSEKLIYHLTNSNLREEIKNKTHQQIRQIVSDELTDIDYMLYTYKSSIPEGLLSETGPDGKVTHYNYDYAGRLISIEDEENLLKEFEYHYAEPIDD
jgi:YD repeat-containing protein